MYRKVGPQALLYPTLVWVVVLATLFLTETLVMFLLPMLRNDHSPVFEAFIDSVVVTVVLAPVIWWTLVRPLRHVIRLRTRFLADLFAAIENERRQTARELHDGIGQELSLLVSGLRSAHELVTDPEQSARCGRLQGLAESALREVKRIALGLRPSLLDDLGLAVAIEKLVSDCGAHSPTEFTLKMGSLGALRLPEPVETAVFRIAQEALANIVRHSRAKSASIELVYTPCELTLTIVDDGQGFDPEQIKREGSHMGVIGMRERAMWLGGELAIESAPGAGCTVTLRLPLREGVRRG